MFPEFAFLLRTIYDGTHKERPMLGERGRVYRWFGSGPAGLPAKKSRERGRRYCLLGDREGQSSFKFLAPEDCITGPFSSLAASGIFLLLQPERFCPERIRNYKGPTLLLCPWSQEIERIQKKAMLEMADGRDPRCTAFRRIRLNNDPDRWLRFPN